MVSRVSETAVAPLPEVPVRELERQLQATRGTDARIELLREIAGRNDAEAVQALTRVFHSERHPTVKLQIVSLLGDVDEQAAPQARMELLKSALAGQARDVRLAAIDLLAGIETKEASGILRRIAATDPDTEVRQLAASLSSGAAPREDSR